jgi:hypothetical protein
MEKLPFLLLMGMFFCSSLQAQESILANDSVRYTKYNVYGELGGPGALSLNVERLFPIRKSIATSGRIGLGLPPYRYIPITQSFLFGNKYAFEVGYGATIAFYEGEDAFGGRGPVKWLHTVVGLRYQKPEGGFLFRLGYTPIIGTKGLCLDAGCIEVERIIVVTHLAGISVGGRLKVNWEKGLRRSITDPNR